MEYSVVIPVYNSKDALPELVERIDRVLRKMSRSYEMILVDDSSSDTSWEVMKRLHQANRMITIIRLADNFGQQRSTLCGIARAQGDYMITIDDDLQHFPEEILKLREKLDEGFDAVIAAFESPRKKLFRRLGSNTLFYLMRKIFNMPADFKTSSFRIMRRSIAERICKLPYPSPYINGMILSITHKVANVRIPHGERRYGVSNYNLSQLLRVLFTLFLNFWPSPLVFFAKSGMVLSTLMSILASWPFIVPSMAAGFSSQWAGLTNVVCFSLSIMLFSASLLLYHIIGLYKETAHTAHFVIGEFYERKDRDGEA